MENKYENVWNDPVTEALLKRHAKREKESLEEADFKKTHTINGNMSNENRRNLETILKHFGPEIEVDKLIDSIELVKANINEFFQSIQLK